MRVCHPGEQCNNRIEPLGDNRCPIAQQQRVPAVHDVLGRQPVMDMGPMGLGQGTADRLDQRQDRTAHGRSVGGEFGQVEIGRRAEGERRTAASAVAFQGVRTGKQRRDKPDRRKADRRAENRRDRTDRRT